MLHSGLDQAELFSQAHPALLSSLSFQSHIFLLLGGSILKSPNQNCHLHTIGTVRAPSQLTQQRKGSASFPPLLPQLKPEGGGEQPIFLHSQHYMPGGSLLRNQKSTTSLLPREPGFPGSRRQRLWVNSSTQGFSMLLTVTIPLLSSAHHACMYVCRPAFLCICCFEGVEVVCLVFAFILTSCQARYIFILQWRKLSEP